MKGVEDKLGATSLAGLGDGTVTGAINYLFSNMVGRYRSFLGEQSLDTLTDPGLYIQGVGARASTDLGYPIKSAGYIEVLRNPNSKNLSDGWIMQRFTPYDQPGIYIRTRSYDNTWHAWQKTG